MLGEYTIMCLRGKCRCPYAVQSAAAEEKRTFILRKMQLRETRKKETASYRRQPLSFCGKRARRPHPQRDGPAGSFFHRIPIKLDVVNLLAAHQGDAALQQGLDGPVVVLHPEDDKGGFPFGI